MQPRGQGQLSREPAAGRRLRHRRHVDIDLATDAIAHRCTDGNDVYLKDLWPTHKEIADVKASCVSRDQFVERYADVFSGNETWNKVPVSKSELYPWDEASTYIQNPPFFDGMTEDAPGFANIDVEGARALPAGRLSVTTDHISPAGRIEPETGAGKYLLDSGVTNREFNSFGSRRGNDRVMTRGTFANVRVKNKLAIENGKAREGGWTRDFTKANTLAEAPISYIFDAAMNYRQAGTPLVVLAGKDYGMGSSRDWAAKGSMLLGVRAVIAESFERIHRSNLVFMGVLPLQFTGGASAQSLGLTGDETFDIALPDPLGPGAEIEVNATPTSGGAPVTFKCKSRIDTPIEIEYYRNGGILQTVIRKKLNEARQTV